MPNTQSTRQKENKRKKKESGTNADNFMQTRFKSLYAIIKCNPFCIVHAPARNKDECKSIEFVESVHTKRPTNSTKRLDSIIGLVAGLLFFFLLCSLNSNICIEPMFNCLRCKTANNRFGTHLFLVARMKKTMSLFLFTHTYTQQSALKRGFPTYLELEMSKKKTQGKKYRRRQQIALFNSENNTATNELP